MFGFPVIYFVFIMAFVRHSINCFEVVGLMGIETDTGWLSSVLRPRQHSIGHMGDGVYRSKDPTNSIKVLKDTKENGYCPCH